MEKEEIKKVVTLKDLKTMIAWIKTGIVHFGEENYIGPRQRQIIFEVSLEFLAQQILKDNNLTETPERASELPDTIELSTAACRYILIILAIVRKTAREKNAPIPSLWLDDQISLNLSRGEKTGNADRLEISEDDYFKGEEILTPYCKFLEILENLPEWLDWAEENIEKIKECLRLWGLEE